MSCLMYLLTLYKARAITLCPWGWFISALQVQHYLNKLDRRKKKKKKKEKRVVCQTLQGLQNFIFPWPMQSYFPSRVKVKIQKTDERGIDIYFNLSEIKPKSAETSAMTAKVVTWLSPPAEKWEREPWSWVWFWSSPVWKYFHLKNTNYCSCVLSGKQIFNPCVGL